MTTRPAYSRRRTLAAAVITASMAAALLAPTSASGADAATSFQFDFGGSTTPVADGWIGINPASAYSVDTGYGFLVAPSTFRDRTGDDAMLRDFTLGGNAHFAVDVPDGVYEVTTWTGDLIAGNRTNLDVEGTVGGGGSSTGQFFKGFFTVEVSDGQLNIRVTGGDGRLNGILVQSPVPTPTGLIASEVVAGDTSSVTLDWDVVDGADEYVIYRAEAGAELTEIARVGNEGYADAGVVLGENYDYAVAARDGDRLSPKSETLSVAVVDETVDPPATPVGIVASDVQREQLTLTWDDDDAVVRWKVYRSTRADIPFELVGTVTEPTFTDTDVLTTRPYLYRLVAVNAGGPSDSSETFSTPVATTLIRQAEHLDRAPVAVALDEGVYIGWRLLGMDDRELAFHIYRDGERITATPLTGATNFLDAEGSADSEYQIAALIDGDEVSVTDVFGTWAEQQLDIPLNKPEGGVTPTGGSYTYSPGDASVGDLDGDGDYEIVLLWNPSNAQDNSIAGYTGNVYMDAYELDGTQLWRIDLGVNIRAGAHYTQFQVYDLDGDGRAEVAFKTADGTTDGEGTVIGDPDADYRNATGYILSGPEYLTVFDGLTGAALDTVDFIPSRGDVGSWGDTYGNRVDRFLAAVGYFDGERPSLMFSRGYYTRSVLTAWDFRDGELVTRWTFDSDEWGEEYEEQGNHNVTTADVDRDGLDEVVFGSMTIDDDGTPLYNSNLYHGDVLHVGDHVIDRPGLEIFSTFESPQKNGGVMAAMRDAETGAIVWKSEGPYDTARGSVADIDPSHPGAEAWHPYSEGVQTIEGLLKNAHGELLSETIPNATFTAYWDADPLRELVSHEFDPAIRAGVPLITKWDPATSTEAVLFRAEGTLTNGTQAQPLLQLDMVGDWREELLLRHADGNALRLITTVDETNLRIPTLMHDPQYRQAVAWVNTAYNQPPRPSFFIGADMEDPPQANLQYVGDNPWPGAPMNPEPTFTPGPISKSDLDETNEIDLGLGDRKFTRGATEVTLQGLDSEEWYFVYLNETGLGWHKGSDVGEITVSTPAGTEPGDNRFVLISADDDIVGWDRILVVGPRG